jgi:hypothetical protein
MSGEMQSHVRWRTAAVALALLGCALPVAARLAAGPQGGDVHVEWRPSIDGLTRERLAARYRLENPRKLADPYTWRYDLADPSRDNIRALVEDAAVEDTHEIDRSEYILAPTAPRTARRGLSGWGDTLVGTADGLAVGLALLAVIVLATRTAPMQLLVRGIPQLSAAGAGLFRIVFGIAALAFFVSHPTDESWLTATFDLEIEGRLHALVIDWLRGHPGVVSLLSPWLLLTGVAFTAGFLTRLTYPLFVAGALLRAFVAVTIESTHPGSVLVLTLVALLPARWSDALSVDAWLRHTRGRDNRALPASQEYGYCVWVPGLVLGLAWAAAAWAKLSVPPGWTDWILNGTVTYHFVSDAVNAPLDWGLQFAKHPTLAILASLGVIVLEGMLITAAFSRNEWYRLALGTAALSLFSGFYLFMGVFWPAWWILLLGFLPWQWLSRHMRRASAEAPADAMERRPEPSALGSLPAAQVAVIALLIAQQLVASTLRLERAPMFSWYDMYSATYASPQVWNASRPPLYRLVVFTEQGRTELPACNPHEEFVREFETALKGSAAARTHVWQALRGCGPDLAGARDVILEGDVRTFDWDRLRFTVNRSAVTLGPLLAEAEPVTTGRR